jgi:hypothetical protein
VAVDAAAHHIAIVVRVALYVAPIWFGLLGVAYVRMKPSEYVTQITAIGRLGLEYKNAKDHPRNKTRLDSSG